MLRHRLLIGISLFGLAACSSSSKTDEQGNEALWPQCVESRQSIGLDDETPFGVTAREAFESAKGEHLAELRWYAGGVTELRFAITSEISEVQIVDREPNQGTGEGAVLALAPDCSDFLEAKVGATFKTEDGAFDESFDDLRIEAVPIMDTFGIRAHRSLDLDHLGGSYTPTELSPSEYDRILQASISLSIDEEGRLEGSFSYTAEKTHGEGNEGTVSARPVTAATWE